MIRLLSFKTLVVMTLPLFFIACTNDSAFTLNSEEAVFEQSVTRTQVKVDILWVVDNSGSMETSQDNVASNFSSFIQKFQQTNFDYQMAVTTTEAWRAPVEDDPELSRFRDGTDATGYSGVKIIKPDTPDLEATFITNLRQGTTGSGDERGWQSLQETLTMQANLDDNFPRADALLAVIFLTDEDDFSHDGTQNISGGSDPYSNPDLHDPLMYYDFLYNLTGSSEESLNFQVNTIGIFDDACLQQLNTTFTGRKIASRYASITDKTNGYKGSLCDDFTDVLSGISDSILERGTAFKLGREPVESTIEVKVNGKIVPNSEIHGWTYEPDGLLIVFHGDAIPGSDDIVTINYDPAGLK